MPRPYWYDQFRETAEERRERWEQIKDARIDAGLCPICAKPSDWCICGGQGSLKSSDAEGATDE